MQQSLSLTPRDEWTLDHRQIRTDLDKLDYRHDIELLH